MKGNNVIPNAHFRKDWQRYVRVWLNQPAKKQARRAAREARAKRLAPRPVDKLHPIVRGQTNKYNMKIRAGRGFTLDELQAAKIRRKEANGIGITVDHRRKNRSEDAFQQNVARLKFYRSKLILFPRKPANKRAKKGDANRDECKKASQSNLNDIAPIELKLSRASIKPRPITADERKDEVVKRLHKEWQDAKLWGRREKRARDKKEGKAKKDKKDAKGGAEGATEEGAEGGDE